MSSDRDYVAPAKVSETGFLGALWTGVAVSLCFLLFRFYVRLKIFRRFHIEDPFVLAAWLMNLANAVVWQKVASKLYLSIAVASGQKSMPAPEVSSYDYLEPYSLFASSLLFYSALWSVKLSFLLFFRNIGNYIRRQMILWYCVLAYTVASYIACLGLLEYKCLVERGSLGECKSGHAAHYVPIHLWVATVLDTTTDALIILISTNLLWNASVELRKKLALTGIFCLTIIIISVSIIRVVLTTGGSRLDLTWLLLWSGLEMTASIIVACLASFRILYTRSGRSRSSVSNNDHSYRAAEPLSDDSSIPLSARLVHPIPISASENAHYKRQTSTDTFEEAILPMDNVYGHHKYDIFPGPRETCEEIRSPLETPVVRLHSQRIPSYFIIRDTASQGFGHI